MSETVLEISSKDLRIYVSSTSARYLYNKASYKNDLPHATRYEYTEGSLILTQLDSENAERFPIPSSAETWPVFFENTSYLIEFEFSIPIVGKPYIYHHLKEITNQFNYRNGRLSGSLNFGNEIGKFKLEVHYRTTQELNKYALTFEVFPVKLNYRRDYQRIINEIQSEYPLLVLDFLKKTETGQQIGKTAHEFIWWHLFQQIYSDLTREAKYILARPHNRLISQDREVRAEQLIHLDASLEEEFARFRKDPTHRYNVSKKVLSVDTVENRFIKYALQWIFIQYKYLFDYINLKLRGRLSEVFHDEYTRQFNTLSGLVRHPLWKGVGEFKGFRQESIAIKQKPGYAGFYRSFLILQQGICFFEGVAKIELKNIAELYQIWCFIQLKKILTNVTGVQPDATFTQKFERSTWSQLRIEEAFSCFTFDLGHGHKVELFHDYSYNRSGGRNPLQSYTIPQRPDITLRIYKPDIPNTGIHTYLFDAKYQVNTFVNGELVPDDEPPPDTLNQMHRYRDALYFRTRNSFNQAEKGVIGGYILFPGVGDNNDVRLKNYFTSIAEVNIGAFPLNFSNCGNHELLEDFVKNKIVTPGSHDILLDVPGQKYVSPDFPEGKVLIAGSKGDTEHQKFISGDLSFYYLPMKTPEVSRFHDIKYFSPWIKEYGCDRLYKVISIERMPRNKVFDEAHALHEKESEEEYLKIGLEYLNFTLLQPIKLTSRPFYRFCLLSEFLKMKNFADFKNEI